MTSDETKQSIDDEIQGMQTHVKEYRRALNDEGVWLFLATLGCWSVVKPLQFVAIAVTVLLFGRRLQDRLSDRRPFSKMTAALRQRIETELDAGDAQGARLYRLIQIGKTDLSFKTALKEGWVFFACWIFLTITLAHALWG